MKIELTKLVSLAEIDADIDALLERKEELPKEIHNLEKELQKLLSEATLKGDELKNLEHQKNQKEVALAEQTDWVKSRETKSKEIKTNKEFHAANKEVAVAKKNLAKTEEDLKSLASSIEEARGKLEEVTKAHDESKARIEAEIAEKTSLMNDLDGQIKAKENSKGEAKKDIGADFLVRYVSIKAKITPAIAKAENGCCLECYTKIPPQTYIELQKLERLINCPRCHRILYTSN